jgi:hypothetical protein
MRPWKNPNITDIQRARLLRQRVIEERGVAEEIWQSTQPETDIERFIDYIHYRRYELQRRKLQKHGKRGYVYTDRNLGVRMEDHIVSRIACGVLWPDAFIQGRYPLNGNEANQDKMARSNLAGLIAWVRIDPRCRHVAIITDMLHLDPDTGDKDNVIFEGRTEKKTDKKETIRNLDANDVRVGWVERREARGVALEQRTQQTIDNFLRSEVDNNILERQEQDRRRRRPRGGP